MTSGPAAPAAVDALRAESEATPLPVELLLTTHRILAASDTGTEALSFLHGDLFDSRPVVAISALSAVAARRDARSLPFVTRLLGVAAEEVQCAAVRTMGSIRHPDVTRILLRLAKTARTEALRREILAALAAAAPREREVLTLIRDAAWAPLATPASRAHACGILLTVAGEPALEALLRDARDAVLDRIIDVAAETPALVPRTVAHCAPQYAQLPVRTRVALVSLACSQQLPESSGMLRCALRDPNAEVRRAAYSVLATAAHQVPWYAEAVSAMVGRVETIPALEDEAHQAIGRMAQDPGARSALPPAVRGAVMAAASDLFKQLSAVGRKVTSDTHELGWLITRSKDYLEYYGNDDFKGALLRWLKGASADTTDGLMKMLKATAVRVEVGHFDGYSALADLIKNPKRTGIALVARELALAHPGKAVHLWRLGRALRLAALFLSPEAGAADRELCATIYAWARQGKLFRLAEAALIALARVDPRRAEEACGECLALPLASKVLAIAALHLLRELHGEMLVPAATRLISAQDDPYVTMNALEAIATGSPLDDADLARALLARFAMTSSREVQDALVSFLGESIAHDITESLKEPALTGDDRRRAAALSILDRRISKGLVANRDGTVEFLYRILRGEHEPSRRSAALMLWKLGDDYAAPVLRDFLAEAGDDAAVEILRGLQGWLREPLVAGLGPLFRRESETVHAALRELLEHAPDEAVRRRAVETAIALRGDGSGDEEALPGEGTPVVELRSERAAFQFEREYVQDLVMFFSDIQGYSKKAQVLPPMQLAALIQEYEKILLSHVEAHRGELVKRMGDGHLFVFRDALPAVLAAIRLQKSLRRFNRYRDENNRVVIRIGIHGGKVVRKAQGDVLGNAVNIASRLESSARPGSILVSDRIHDRVKDSVHAREIGVITVKNISEPVRVFEPYEIMLDLPAELDPLRGSRGPAAPDATVADGTAATGFGAPAGPVVLDPATYGELVRCSAVLADLCRERAAGPRDPSSAAVQALARWERLRTRLPGPGGGAGQEHASPAGAAVGDAQRDPRYNAPP
jgi:class 3 adenylate cyclase